MRTIAKIFGSFLGSLLLVSCLIFSIVHLTPGNIAQIHNLSDATAHQLYLDRSIPVQYLLWLKGCLLFDFGMSMTNGARVSTLIAEYAPPTLLLTFGSLFLSLLISIPLGIWRGLRPVSPLGKWISLGAYTLSSIPVFVLGYIVLAVVFGVFKFFVTAPPEGEFKFWPFVSYYFLPILVLAIGNGTIGEFIRFISLEVQNVNGAMFIKAARARGSQLWKHFFKSMMLPIFNIIVTNMAVLLGGIVVVERIFNFHGLGWLSWEATLKRDFSVIMGITLAMAFLIRLFMMVNDLLAVWLDPRTRE